MTVYWMPSIARDVTQTRFLGAALALLVQACLIAAAFLALTQPVVLPRVIQREMTLWLRTLHRGTPQAAPRTIDARGPSRARITPEIKLPQAPSSLPAPAGPDASGLRAFGRALFGCAPERYAELSPEDRAHCPKPGEGLAYQPPDLMGAPSHVKNNVRWANALAHKQSPLELPGGFNFPLALLGALLDGSVTDSSSDFRDPEKWPTYNDTGKLMPHSLHDQERAYEAWHKDHPVQ